MEAIIMEKGFAEGHVMLSASSLDVGTCCDSDFPRPVHLFIVPLGLFSGAVSLWEADSSYVSNTLQTSCSH